MKYDAIIIGAGLGGLTTAIILAKEHKKVLVLEQHTKAGGYLHSFYRHGHRFETGFHFAPALEENQILSMYWKYLGIYDKLEIIQYKKEKFHTLKFPNYEINLPQGLDNLQEKLISLFPKEKDKITTYIKDIKRLRTYFVYFNQNHTGDMGEEHKSFEVTITEYLDSLQVSKELKSIILAHSFLYGVPPQITPLGTHAIFFNALYSSCHDIKGGGDALAGALIDSLKANGGKIKFKSKVTSIRTQDKGVKGVEAENGEYYETDMVISSINPKSSLSLFEENVFRRIYKTRINDMKETISHFGLYAATSSDLSTETADTLYFPTNNIADIYKNPISNLPDDFFLYATVPTSRIGKSHGKDLIEILCIDSWDNYSKWHSHALTKKKPNDYHEFKNKIQDHILNKITSLYPQIFGAIDFVESSTPLTNYYYTLSPKGSIYGLEHNMGQMRSPIRARTKVKNFFLTGQSLIFPGIVGVTITGFVTCADILGQEYLFSKIDKEIKK